jgi:hypothetical protein
LERRIDEVYLPFNSPRISVAREEEKSKCQIQKLKDEAPNKVEEASNQG